MEEVTQAGVLLAGEGLHPTSKGAKVKLSGGKFTVTDGPFTESKEIIAGYTLIQVKTREEGIEWAKRFPPPHGQADGEIEIRQLYEVEDFGPSEAIERFRELGVAGER
jgi:hypothetical protein